MTTVSIPTAAEELERIKAQEPDKPTFYADHIYLALQAALGHETARSEFGVPQGDAFCVYMIRKGRGFVGPNELVDEVALEVRSFLANGFSWIGPSGRPRSLVANEKEILSELKRVCWKNQRDVFKDWLEEQKGTDEPALWLSFLEALGYSPSEGEDTELVALYIRKQMMASVARTLRPGCKVDSTIILSGVQGAKKTTTLKALFGEENVCDSFKSFNNKDDTAFLSRYAAVELAELSGIRGRDVNDLKHELTKQNDESRDPYAMLSKRRPRRCTFWGTTNNQEFLTDPTGNRRYWPVRCDGKLDLAWIEANRGAIWGAAMAAFKAGEDWWLSDAEEERQKVHVDGFREITVEEERLHDALEEKAAVDKFKLATLTELVFGSEIVDGRQALILRSAMTACGLARKHFRDGWWWVRGR